jgi:hypothetical protein
LSVRKAGLFQFQIREEKAKSSWFSSKRPSGEDQWKQVGNLVANLYEFESANSILVQTSATIDCKVGGPAQFSGGNVCVFACKCTTLKLTKAHALDDERALACEQGECVQG